MKIDVYVCSKCGKANGFIAGVKTTKCKWCNKTHNVISFYKSRNIHHAKNEKEAREIIQKLNWNK